MIKNLLSATDEKWHDRDWRLINSASSLTHYDCRWLGNNCHNPVIRPLLPAKEPTLLLQATSRDCQPSHTTKTTPQSRLLPPNLYHTSTHTSTNQCGYMSQSAYLTIASSSRQPLSSTASTSPPELILAFTVPSCITEQTPLVKVLTYSARRWLGEEKKVRKMKNTLLTFSSGKGSCLRKNVAGMEIAKLIPSMIQAFEVR